MKILIGYDGSPAARAAVDLALGHARAFGGEVLVVTSVPGGPEVERRVFDNAERDLQEVAETVFRPAGVACVARLSISSLSAGEDLVRLARKQEIEEIVIGVKRRSKVGKMLFGSTAQYVILNAPCPVVTVR